MAELSYGEFINDFDLSNDESTKACSFRRSRVEVGISGSASGFEGRLWRRGRRGKARMEL